MLDTAYILIHRQPAIGDRRNGWRIGLWRGEARIVPGRIDERVHGVGFTPGFAAALRAMHVLPSRVMVERIAGLVEADVLGQHHWQVFFGHGNSAANLAVDHRDRAAPIALARYAPVAQPIIDLEDRKSVV